MPDPTQQPTQQPAPQPTTRQVIDLLKQSLHLNNRRAQHLLSAGLAGAPVADGRARRYDAARVRALASAPDLSDDQVWDACPSGVFIARIAAHRGFHVEQPHAEQAQRVCDGWYVPWFGHVWLNLHDGADGTFPFIATLADFVVFGATIVGREVYGDEHRSTNRAFRLTRFSLDHPGSWFESLQGRRLVLGPGYPWKMWGAPVSAPFDRTGLADEAWLNAMAARAARRRGRPRPPAPPASRPRSAAPPPAQTA